MWKLLSSPTDTRIASTPDGLRIYAIGDIHGRADLLAQLFDCIDEDIAAFPVPNVLQISLGDYIDRGPDSRKVLDLLISRCGVHPMVCLKGNHEALIPSFLSNPSILEQWKHYGGFETLMSYGITPSINADEQEQERVAAAFERALPNDHRRFLAGLKTSFTCGDYFFVHAGVRPGVPLSKQNEQDLLWIREEFLLDDGDFSKVVIHGHTPVMEPEIRPNRINIDTGAYATGRLTCLVLEGEKITFI